MAETTAHVSDLRQNGADTMELDADSTEHKTADDEPIVSCRTDIGCNLLTVTPLFSSDSKYLFVAAGRFVRVYSTRNGHLVHWLHAGVKDARNDDDDDDDNDNDGDVDDVVVSIVRNPENLFQVISCSRKGEIVYWDYEDGIALKRFNIGEGIKDVWMSATSHSDFAFIFRNSALFYVDELKNPAEIYKVFDSMEGPRNLSIGMNGSFVAKITPTILTVFLLDSKTTTRHFSSKKQVFTCVAAHPNEYCVATGNAEGKIFLWYNVQTNSYVRSLLHWHQLPVAALSFTAEGTHLYSGGGECVLIKWNVNTYTRTPIPRLGMPICDVACSPDSRMTAVCHADNAIHLLSDGDELTHVIQGLTRRRDWATEHETNPFPTGLIYESRTRALVMNGKPGHLQFYSLAEDKLLFNLDITYRNYLHRERSYSLPLIEVQRAAFDSTGNWLATVEMLLDSELQAEICLKFWKFEAEKQNFVLNVTMESPHKLTVNALQFRPNSNEPLCVSTSDDTKFKYWTLADDDDDEEEETKDEVVKKNRIRWTCDCVGYFRRAKAGDAAFNEQGSLLAVVFERAVTLWDPDSNAIHSTLVDPFCHEEIKRIVFGVASSSHLLVSVARENVSVWNVDTSCVESRIERTFVYLTRDCQSNLMAAFDEKNNLFVFTPDKVQSPVHEIARVSDKKIVGAVFVPKEKETESKEKDDSVGVVDCQEKSQLYFMDADEQLFTLSRKDAQEERKYVPMQQNLPETAFANLLRQPLKKREDLKESAVQLSSREAQVVFEELVFTTPSHMLPAPSALLELFHKAYLKPAVTRTAANLQQRRDKKMKKDVEMMNEEEEDSAEEKNNDDDSVDEKDETKTVESKREDQKEKEITTEKILKMTNNFEWLGKVFSRW